MRTTEERDAIRYANDLLRTHLFIGRVAAQPAFRELDRPVQAALLTKLRDAPLYDRIADPDDEHRAGYATANGAVVSWQILYYDARVPGFKCRSPNPADVRVTQRVLLLDSVPGLPPHLAFLARVTAPVLADC